MLKLLGIIDLFLGVLILFWPLFPQKFLLYLALYILFKGFIFAFFGDLVSWIDVFVGFYVILLSFGISFSIITIIGVLYLVQKGLFSLV